MKVNGEFFSLTEPISLHAFLLKQGYAIERVAVERNGEIVPRRYFDEVLLSDEDTIEVVRFVGGG